ncbi:DUF3558 domain-containing protein [Streptomyces sp. CBMA29]|uniref:DUF3558 domain-containing protein n=1 Tax=Streptomyces sp. CBMA29 TaxID=1896314 RepID=UPI00166214C5|nr:DUF3558 domain-containing protein [Streptomyces sp. CBMA29]MBD0736342.1 hypothetical protein [Streptomyces sp. CBMA29]
MERRHTASRLALLLACAAVPAMALAGCSSGSGSSDAKSTAPSGSSSTGSGSSGGSATPTLAPAKFAALPASCKAVAQTTVNALVPKAKTPGGSPVKSDDITSRAGCSWTGNGKDGYQYRWLSVTLQRFTSSTALGAAEDQAKKRYTEQVGTLNQVPGAASATLTGFGDQAASVGSKATVAKVTSQNDSVVVRSGNVVILVEFNGAGLEGKKNPSAGDVQSGAQRAAKEAVAAVAAANA